MDDIANDIATGNLSTYLVKPINYLAYWFTRRLASRSLHLVMAILETLIFLMIIKPDLGSLLHPLEAPFIAIIILALVLFILFDFIVGLTAFWTFRAYGPRFALKVVMEFASGRYFPLLAIPFGIGKALEYLPFSYMVYWPTLIFKGSSFSLTFWLVGGTWVILLTLALKFAWKRGLRSYEAVGG